MASGGGISGAYLAVKDSRVTGNSTAGESSHGGGLAAGYFVRVERSTISGNIVSGYLSGGGGVFCEAGAFENGSANVIDSTVSGNSAVEVGGGIFAYGLIRMVNSTVSGNSGGRVGGITAYYAVELSNSTVSGNTGSFTGGISGDDVNLTNSIVFGNAGGTIDEVSGDLALSGGNIVGPGVFSGRSEIGRTTASQVFETTVALSGGVLAGELADNGGPTRTIALKFDVSNPALGGATAAETRDQRGVIRDPDPDLGAFEAVAGLMLVGGRGPDTLRGAALPDQLYGRGGDDELRGRAGDDQLRGDAGRDRLSGGEGDDRLFGGDGRDRLAGGLGDDRLFGGDGDDRLRGGPGDDLLSGGKGSDRFLFAPDFGRDVITDFDANPAGGQDVIDLRAFAISSVDFFSRVRLNTLGDDTRITVDDTSVIVLRRVSGEGADRIDPTDFLL